MTTTVPCSCPLRRDFEHQPPCPNWMPLWRRVQLRDYAERGLRAVSVGVRAMAR